MHQSWNVIIGSVELINFSGIRINILYLYFVESFEMWSVTTGPIYLDFNSLRPSDAYRRHQTGSSSFQVMAFRLYSVKPLPVSKQTRC